MLFPLWRRWPGAFDVLGLWTGALAPDVVDGIASPLLRGRLGQWGGHSLLGLFTACTLVSLALDAALRSAVVRWSARRGWGLHPHPSRGKEVVSIWIGVLSHDVADLLSHEQSLLLWPFSEDPRWFPDAWYHAWFSVPVPGYRLYPIGPHFIAWLMLTVGGAYAFFRWPPIKVSST